MSEIKNHPATVKFGEIECCVLGSAIIDLAHRKFINEFINWAKKKEPKHSWAILTEIFINTIRLIFIPREVHRKFYFNLARLEKKQLMEGNKTPTCGHTIKEHIEALDNICFLMVCPIGTN